MAGGMWVIPNETLPRCRTLVACLVSIERHFTMQQTCGGGRHRADFTSHTHHIISGGQHSPSLTALGRGTCGACWRGGRGVGAM